MEEGNQERKPLLFWIHIESVWDITKNENRFYFECIWTDADHGIIFGVIIFGIR